MSKFKQGLKNLKTKVKTKVKTSKLKSGKEGEEITAAAADQLTKTRIGEFEKNADALVEKEFSLIKNFIGEKRNISIQMGKHDIVETYVLSNKMEKFWSSISGYLDINIDFFTKKMDLLVKKLNDHYSTLHYQICIDCNVKYSATTRALDSKNLKITLKWDIPVERIPESEITESREEEEKKEEKKDA